jgi:hypothetical protein
MKLISDIINELVNSQISLQGPFLKTKVLASKIKNETLLNWINKELNGYEDRDSIPDYRKHSCLLVGSWMNGIALNYNQGNNFQFPTSGYGKKMDEILGTMVFPHGISALEELSKGDSKVLHIPLSLDFLQIITNRMQKIGNPYMTVTSASKQISSSIVVDILASMRSNLLDFMLMLDDEFGGITDINKLSEQKSINEKVTSIMNQTIINANGDGNVVTTGNNNSISNTVKKGQFETLQKVLRENGVEQLDINELKEAVETEQTSEEASKPDSKVNQWVKKMLGKAVDGSWQIGLGAAGQLLGDAIKAYLGSGV